ncbi:SAM-dependent DNA methyltransferase [Candidatus Woesearchaeota archaeon]|nr:SAM-dependent DNA methyltransferase [Candidatus Woesearchaeota archaeon]
MGNFQEKVSFIWDQADLLRGTYKRNEYQKVILPFTVLKRFDCVLEHSKEKVLNQYNKLKGQIDNLDLALKNEARDKDGKKLGFYNYSKYDFKTLLEDPENIEQNMIHYIDSFSKNVQEIFEYFNLKGHISKLSKADLLFRLVKKYSESRIDLHPETVSNHEMGTIFEELIRKFSEQSNEEAGDHFTPKEVVELMTKLLFIYEKKTEQKDVIKTVYDPACGTGGMLSSCHDYLSKYLTVALFGQELNEEIYAIAKADMLMRGDDAEIKGPKSTLSEDQFEDLRADYIISNPPYGTKWEKDQDKVLAEAELGEEGRYGAGTPRINDGQLLFLQHMISKMKTNDEKSRIAAITNGSPLFTGDAGSGESNIRKWMIENDYIEAIIALPGQLFYNTGITTYIWVMSNQKSTERVGKIQLIDARSFFKKMRKSLGDKRNELDREKDIPKILELYKDFKPSSHCKIMENEVFGYTKVTVERPLQLNFTCSQERLDHLYALSGFAKLAESKKKNPEDKLAEETAGKEQQDKIIEALSSIKGVFKHWDPFESEVKQALKTFDLTPSMVKGIILALSEHDDSAEYITKKGKKQPDANLRDTEKIPLKQDINEYFKKEVTPYYKDAWMDRSKDKIGYEINFTQYFYKYKPPRSLEDIQKDIDKITQEIQDLQKEEL